LQPKLGEGTLSACLVTWLPVKFTRSHTKYSLVKKKKLLSTGRTHQKLSCATGLGEAVFCYFSQGRNHNSGAWLHYSVNSGAMLHYRTVHVNQCEKFVFFPQKTSPVN
jgi:hypothetical protein